VLGRKGRACGVTGVLSAVIFCRCLAFFEFEKTAGNRYMAHSFINCRGQFSLFLDTWGKACPLHFSLFLCGATVSLGMLYGRFGGDCSGPLSLPGVFGGDLAANVGLGDDLGKYHGIRDPRSSAMWLIPAGPPHSCSGVSTARASGERTGACGLRYLGFGGWLYV